MAPNETAHRGQEHKTLEPPQSSMDLEWQTRRLSQYFRMSFHENPATARQFQTAKPYRSSLQFDARKQQLDHSHCYSQKE